MSNNVRRLYRNAQGHIWCGDSPGAAVDWSELPSRQDARWITGTPDVLDVRVLTLSAAGVWIDSKPSSPPVMAANFDAFAGVTHWIQLDQIVWTAFDCGACLPGEWEDIGSGYLVREVGNAGCRIEARIYDAKVVLRAKSLQSLGGVIQASECFSEFRIPYQATKEVAEAVRVLEERIAQRSASDLKC